MEKRALIESIQSEIQKANSSAIAKDFVNALNLISEVVFSRSSGFVLEFLQNAEDSGIDLPTSGCFKISINKQRIELIHNGRPFNEYDVRAVCGIRSSKKPERGTLGYLGIGFKSVFKVSDAPEVHSGGYHFAFDKKHWQPDMPWQVLPVWLEPRQKSISEDVTTFIVPFKQSEYYTTLAGELKSLGTELYLFLKWLKRIEINDEVTKEHWVLENLGDKNEITSLSRDGTKQDFRFFRRLVSVPDAIKRDPLTQHFRPNVQEREISIAFALDENGDLAPSEAGAMYGGVYSFLPLGEARSGAKFPIQADFLVQPGRDAINYEAKWNHWLVEEVTELCQTAIQYFKTHPKWKYQFLKAFDFTKSEGLESYDYLFGPKLIKPLTAYLQADDCVPTSTGGWTKASEVVHFTEDPSALAGLISIGLFKGEDEVASVLGGRKGLRLLHQNSATGGLNIKTIDRWDLLKNAEYLKKKAKRTDGPAWFRSLYLWLNKHPAIHKYFYYRWRTSTKGYHEYEILLTTDLQLMKGGAVSFFALSESDTVTRAIADELGKSKKLLQADILDGARDDAERKTIHSFLTGYTGLQVLDAQVVCREAILPKILSSSRKPKRDEVIQHTQYCFSKIGVTLQPGTELWVATKQGDVRPAKEVFLSTEFQPDQNWEKNSQFVSGPNFVSPDYLPPNWSAAQLKLWRDFFSRGGLRLAAPVSMVEEFAMRYAQASLKTKCKSVTAVNKANFGYDLEALLGPPVKPHRARMHIEVKGQTGESDVELTPDETAAADKHKGNYYLCVVASIPENPVMHVVQNPSAPGIGRKEKLTIPIKVWKQARWP